MHYSLSQVFDCQLSKYALFIKINFDCSRSNHNDSNYFKPFNFLLDFESSYCNFVFFYRKSLAAPNLGENTSWSAASGPEGTGASSKLLHRSASLRDRRPRRSQQVHRLTTCQAPTREWNLTLIKMFHFYYPPLLLLVTIVLFVIMAMLRYGPQVVDRYFKKEQHRVEDWQEKAYEQRVSYAWSRLLLRNDQFQMFACAGRLSSFSRFPNSQNQLKSDQIIAAFQHIVLLGVFKWSSYARAVRY